MEDRYEIREKIGQGGIGSVNCAYDHRMGRQVAIKRILTSSEDPTLEQEATNQMMAEIGALASLQHPHIVTVFDVGSDEEGPFVVMEMIHGKTLDEIIENAPLVWDDFKLLSMQALEALIAAQEMNMIHSDLKPPNIMLTWMPSGAFQVKIVDFGLAKLIHKQSQEEIDEMDSVYGSVFFMPPEQFERKILDARSDLYSLGCCLYQSLVGSCPFTGDTVAEVAQAHLDHTVRPIQEVRDDIPPWACEWVMWMINRNPEDRPPNAREALANFIQNDRNYKPAINPSETSTPKNRLITSSTAPLTATGSFPTSAETSSVHANPDNPSPQAAQEITAAQSHVGSTDHGKTKSAKKLLMIIIPAAAVLLLAMAISLIMKRNEAIRLKNEYHNVVAMAASNNVRQIQISDAQLQIVFDFIENAKPNTNLAPAYQALAKATTLTNTNIDRAILDFATNTNLPSEIRRDLFEKAIGKRNSAEAVPGLINFIASAKDAEEALVAFEATRPTIREEHAEGLVRIITTTDHSKIREAAESVMSEIIARSNNRNNLSEIIATANKQADNPSSRQYLERLQILSKPVEQPRQQAQTPPQVTPQPRPQSTQQAEFEGDEELKEILKSFETSDDAGKLAIITALSKRAQATTNGALFVIAANHPQFLTEVIQSLIELNSHPQMLAGDELNNRRRWIRIIWRSKTPEQRIMVIDALAKQRTEWAKTLIEGMSQGKEEISKNHALKVLQEFDKNTQ